MFKTFPQFSRLTLDDREAYEAFIKDFPPIGDISFLTLITWWDFIGSADISILNDNLVISYWTPGDEEHSGLSLIGTNQVEESICAIFDYLREKGERPRLVNVPEFVVHSMRYPELFRFTSQRSDDEYVLSLSRFAELNNLPSYRRLQIKRFMREAGTEDVSVRSLDLSNQENKNLLFTETDLWPKRGFNDLGSIERDALQYVINNADKLAMKNLCLFTGGLLQAYCFYHNSVDPRYVIADYARINYRIPGIFDYMTYAFSRHVLQGTPATFVNIHADLGFAQLRVFKLALRPSEFFRKYIIEPA